VNARFNSAGTLLSGQWVQQYSGFASDPAYKAAMLDYLAWLHDQLGAQGIAMTINAGVDLTDVPNTLVLHSVCDIWGTEAQPIHGTPPDPLSYVGQDWETFFTVVTTHTNAGGAWLARNQAEGAPPAGAFTDLNRIPVEHEAFALASF